MSASDQPIPNVPAVVPAEPEARNKKKQLTFENWPKEVINLPCKEFHRYIKEHALTPEQQSDLRRVRRRKQGRIAAKRCRAKMAAKPSNDKADVRTDVVGNIVKQVGDDIALTQYVITRLQEEVNRMQTAQDAAAVAMLQLSGTATNSTDLSGRRYEDFL
jgi:hypothetical protein